MHVCIYSGRSNTNHTPYHPSQELEEEHKQVVQEKDDLESEVLSSTTSASTESEMTSLKRMKRDMETKIEELEDELDEANVKYVVLVIIAS